MAKRKNTQSPSDPPSDTPSGPSPDDEPKTAATDRPEEEETQGEPSPNARCAADVVARAEAELKRAQEAYRTVRREATERLQAVREKSVGDLIDGTLKAVKKHPGPGVFVAMVIGFFLGRLFRR